MGERIYVKTPEFRGSFVNLVTARAIKSDDGADSEPKYGLAIVLPTGKASTKAFNVELRKAITAACVDKFGKDIPQAKLKHFPIRDGASVGDNGQFDGHLFIRASTKFKPSFCDKHGDKLETEEDLYSGAWYKVKVSVWAWEHKTGGRGVSISLETGIKVRDDDKFGGGGGNAAEDFKEDLGAVDNDLG